MEMAHTGSPILYGKKEKELHDSMTTPRVVMVITDSSLAAQEATFALKP